MELFHPVVTRTGFLDYSWFWTIARQTVSYPRRFFLIVAMLERIFGCSIDNIYIIVSWSLLYMEGGSACFVFQV
ncbi:hypothetical protein CC78DRAFT_362383 [Lojkania enalia]|uniref:Uncharacterized protein n=1 Tax=Lojkania enalia TaxID=147567 RepID=A0A9P4N6Y1_9PLEO|nr:hypothetical protein CC78DRAFT_362383 [Didymosphaeria enalia]